MTYAPNNSGVVVVYLATAVADDGTVDIAYPSGMAQGDFDTNLADSTNTYAILNDNDRLNVADPGISLSYGASVITVTNLSTYSWAAGTKIEFNFDRKDGNNVVYLEFPVVLSKVTAADVVTEIRPGIDGVLEYAEFVVTDPVTTAAKLATFNFEIGTTNVTGLTLALTSATATPLGKSLPFTAPTAGYTLTKASKLSLEAATVTAFVEGQGVVILRIRKTNSVIY